MPRVGIDLGRATDRKPPFKFSAFTRVGFSDTDAQGIVYYGRYLPYFDLARVEYHRHLGLLRIDEGHELVMRASTVEYFAPARFDDLLEVFVRLSRVGRTSVTTSSSPCRQPLVAVATARRSNRARTASAASPGSPAAAPAACRSRRPCLRGRGRDPS